MKLRSILQCPHCGFKVVEKIPVGKPPLQFDCPACQQHTDIDPEECCVFCALGSVPCRHGQQRQEL